MVSAVSSSASAQQTAAASAAVSSEASQQSSQSTTVNASSGTLANDIYVPSAQAASAASVPILSASAFLNGIPQSISAAMNGWNYAPTVDWQTLQKSLSAGNIDASKAALSNYEQALAGSNQSMSSLTAPSSTFLDELNSLGNALDAGNLSSAQSIFGMAQWQQPESPMLGMATGVTQAALDGSQSSQWIQDLVNFASTLSPEASSYNPADGSVALSTGATADAKMNSDLEAVQAVVHEADSNVGAFLSAVGYSSSEVSTIVGELDYTNMTGILGTVTSDIASDLHNTDTFTVTSSISAVSSSDGSASGGVSATTRTFQGSSSIGTSATTSASVEGNADVASAATSGSSAGFAYSFSITETGADGTTTTAGTSGSSYTGTGSSSATDAALYEQYLAALSSYAAQQTVSMVDQLTSSPVTPIAPNQDPSTTAYAAQMRANAGETLQQTQSMVESLLGVGSSASGSATSSMSAYDGSHAAYSSVTVYA